MNRLTLSAEFKGQEKAINLINQVLEKDEVAHAYLFWARRCRQE